MVLSFVFLVTCIEDYRYEVIYNLLETKKNCTLTVIMCYVPLYTSGSKFYDVQGLSYGFKTELEWYDIYKASEHLSLKKQICTYGG